MATKYRVYQSDQWGNYGPQYPTVREGFHSLEEAEDWYFNELFFVTTNITHYPDPEMSQEKRGFYKIVSPKMSALFEILPNPNQSYTLTAREVSPLLAGEPLRDLSTIRRSVTKEDKDEITKRLRRATPRQRQLFSSSEQDASEHQATMAKLTLEYQQFLEQLRNNPNMNIWDMKSALRKLDLKSVRPVDYANFDDFYRSLEETMKIVLAQKSIELSHQLSLTPADEPRPIIAPRQFRPSGMESMSIRKKEKDRNDMLKLIKKNQDGSSARLRSLLRMSGVTGIDPSDFANFDDFYQALEDQTQLGIYKPIPTMQEQLIPLPIEGVEDTPVFLDPSKRRISFAPTASMRFFTPIELEHVIQDESSDFEDSSDSSDSF